MTSNEPSRTDDDLIHVVFDGPMRIDYGQFYICAAEKADDTEDFFDYAFADDQSNGLCGTALPGAITFIVGTNHGDDTALRVELHRTEPAVDQNWEDIVHASFTVFEDAIYRVVNWDTDLVGEPMPLGTHTYQVRYSGSGMDEASDMNPTYEPDRFLVQIWPVESSSVADGVIKQTSKAAAYWHKLVTGADV